MSDSAPTTLNELFLDAIARYRTRPVAMRRKVHGTWAELSYTDLLERVKAVSHALATMGVRAGDRVAILSENRPEWAIADFATLALGAADVPIYPTLPARQVAYILRDSGAAVAFVSSQAQLNKLREVQAECPGLRRIVTFDDMTIPGDALAFSAILAQGAAAPAGPWEATARGVGADDLATLIYTSGTTGDPKGVMLTHGNITSNVVLSLTRIELDGEDECLSFLPLSHIFERMAGHYLMLHCGALINYAGGIETVSWGSRIATLGMRCGAKMTVLRYVERTVSTADRPTSLPVPAVVGRAITGGRPCGMNFPPPFVSSKSSQGRSTPARTAKSFAASIGEPPPTATKESELLAR